MGDIGQGQEDLQSQGQGQGEGSGALARISDSGSTDSSCLSEESSPGVQGETEALGVRLEGREGTPQQSGRARGRAGADGEVCYESPVSPGSTGSSGSERGSGGGSVVKREEWEQRRSWAGRGRQRGEWAHRHWGSGGGWRQGAGGSEACGGV